MLGRWGAENGEPLLRKSNPSYEPISLAGRDDWTLWGTVTPVVEARLS